MYATKKIDVDRHVEECLKKINNETERNLRCFSFAKQYFKIERYEEARRYVTTYLSVRPNSAEAHCLLAKALEKLGKKEAALEAYTTSLRLDSKQNNIVMKVCELLASDDVEIDHSGARYFCEMAQSIDPQSPIIFNLKQRIISSQSDDPSEVTSLILKELEIRPTDVKLRVRLLKHLLQYNMVKEAYKHASDIETKDLPIFHNNISWYGVVVNVLVKYQRSVALPDSLGWEFWFLFVSVLDKLVTLSLEERCDMIKTTTEYIQNLFNFDQTLAKAAANINDCPDKHLTQEFLNHYRAQLCFNMATLVFKQAQKDLNYKEATNMTLPLLFVAYHTPPIDLQSMWFNHAPENRRNMARKWRKEAAFRCSQTGHILQALAKDRKALIIDKATQYSMGMWKEQLYKKIFITRDQQMQIKTSYFLNDQQLIDINLRLPDAGELLKYDEEAQLVFPDSLHHHIWIAMNNKLADLNFSVFEGLQYSVKNLKNCGAETVNILDINAFIYCSTLCAKFNQEKLRHITYYNMDRPPVLPAAVTQELGTLNQNKFFKAVYMMYKNEYDSTLDQLRLTIVDGIKVLRCVDGGLDIKLLVILANIFADRAKRTMKQSEIEFNEARAELYWKSAIPILEKLKMKQAVSYPPNKLFNYKSKEMSITEICTHIEAGKLFNATQLMKKKDYEKALRLFDTLKDPYASFYQAQIYNYMADQQTNQNKENVTSEMRSQNIILLSKARDCFYLTLDRLREPDVDQKHPLNTQLGTEIEKIERLLSRIDPDCTNRNECDGMSDDNVSSAGSAGDHYVTGYSGLGHGTSYFNSTFTPRVETHNHSTPYRFDVLKREARPSPERLDAQLRQLAASKDAAINNILEHNKIMVESHRTLVEEWRSFKDVIANLTSSYDELKDIKKTVSELKTSIDDLDNLKTITDMVYEIKKEVADLKKDINKTSQLSEEDMYGLASDYGADYNINTNLAAYNSNLYSNYQTRMPGASSLYAPPPAMYPGMYPPVAYAYGGLGLPQTASGLQFGSEQQLGAMAAQDLRTISAALSQVHPTVSYGQPITQNVPSTSLLTGQVLAPQLTVPQQQTLFKDSKVATSTVTPSTKAPPVNVVITSSDPLPTTKTSTSQPVLSVTIPPEHLKGNNQPKPQPHNYQIPLPASTLPNTSPSILSKPSPAISTQSLLSNVAPPVYSAVTDTKTPINVSLGLQIERSLDQTFNSSKNEISLNKSNVSTSSIEEHDPCPDFKPIIPLPDEVPLTTGEESETVLFCERAKLFRYSVENKEWRERGVGTLKILLNPETKKIRILMRRDQVHKICANHFLTKDMNLTPMSNSDKAYLWAAHDFADEEVVLEKLCVRFKSSEEAKKFYAAFEEAKKQLNDCQNSPISKQSDTSRNESKSTSLGGFVFSSTPTFKPKQETVVAPVSLPETTKPSPFASFTFGSNKSNVQFSPVVATSVISPHKPSNDGDNNVDEFVPTAEFKPVVPLPELIDVKTGEENSEVLFENRAKLLRFDTSGEIKEWKERGVGIIKLLKDNTVRLVMRRDQVHKVCCNHQILKNMNFQVMSNNPKALTWCAKDFSEGVIKPETFAIRFKTEEVANAFHKAIIKAQESLDENNCVVSSKHIDKHMKSDSPSKPIVGFGDKFKPVKGSWECKNCYIINDGKLHYCLACETPKNDNMPKKSDDASGAAFSFGVANMGAVTNSWGNAFKVKEGSWECNSCYIRNDVDKTHCVSCENPKDDTIAKKTQSEKGINLDTGGLKFSFGIPAATNVPQTISTTTTTSGWGDMFKPKEGTWECKQCLIVNNKDIVNCVACETPKDETVPKKDNVQSKGINLDTPGQKYTFGVPASTQTTTTSKATFTFGQSSILNTPTTPTIIGTQNTDSTSNIGFNFKTNVNSSIEHKDTSITDKFVFGSPQKHDFEFTPRSPRRISTGGKDEESDCSCIEEECDNIYFKPVIPLPDKVEVKTGEEDEEVLYSHRAKLFRFCSGEWKERGLGDIKILKRKDNGKLRVLMRREQVFKICLNHTLTADIKYLPKDDKTWLFYAADFSEGEISNEKFCLRFKNYEIAQEFIKAVNDALNISDAGNESKSNGDDGVEIVFETKVTPEEEKEAIRLGLPPKFLSYRQLPDCACDQCKKDDEYLKELFESEKNTNLTTSTPQSAIFTFKSSTTDTSSSGTTLKGLLSKPSLLVTSSNSSNIFSSPTFTSSNSSNVFGTPTVFGSKSNSSFFQTPSEGGSANFSFTPHTGSSTPNTTSTSNSIFSTSNTNLFSSGSSIFGGTRPVSSTLGLIFGGSNSGSQSIFSAKTESIATSVSKSTGSIFANSTTTTTTTIATTTTSSSIFGASPSVFSTAGGGSIFGKTETTGTIFGNKDSKEATVRPIFGATAPELKTMELKEDDAIVLDSKGGMSFASLAAKVGADAPPAFVKTETTTSTPFAFLGAGAPVFGSGGNNDSKNKSTSEDHDNTGADEEYDPHYDPIVPLPDAIVVSTGEEDEDVLFNERAKLFRYDANTKEWKERGVGQMKILHHPANNTYRFLLRREQVHKVVLNQLIVPDLDLQTMKTSDKAWIWAGYNYTDDGSSLEKLAIRLKNCNMAQQFYKAVTDVIEKVKKIQLEKSTTESNKNESKLIPSTIQNFGVEDVSSSDEQQSKSVTYEEGNDEAADEDEDNDDDEDEDEDDDRTVMFMKRCTLSEEENGEWKTVALGDLQVYYDPEWYAARISVNNDSGVVVSNTLIGVNTEMQLDKNSCIWRAVEWNSDSPRYRTLKATFSSNAAAQEFHSNYLEGLNYAHESDVIDELPQVNEEGDQ